MKLELLNNAKGENELSMSYADIFSIEFLPDNIKAHAQEEIETSIIKFGFVEPILSFNRDFRYNKFTFVTGNALTAKSRTPIAKTYIAFKTIWQRFFVSSAIKTLRNLVFNLLFTFWAKQSCSIKRRTFSTMSRSFKFLSQTFRTFIVIFSFAWRNLDRPAVNLGMTFIANSFSICKFKTQIWIISKTLNVMGVKISFTPTILTSIIISIKNLLTPILVFFRTPFNLRYQHFSAFPIRTICTFRHIQNSLFQTVFKSFSIVWFCHSLFCCFTVFLTKFVRLAVKFRTITATNGINLDTAI